jgi:hypothetical protein
LLMVIMLAPSWANACNGGRLAGGTASGVSCHGWQPPVLNAVSLASMCTTCDFLLIALSMMSLPLTRFQ